MSIALDEAMRVKHLQLTEPVAGLSPLPPIQAGSHSSISEAEGVRPIDISRRASRPVLEPPKENALLGFIRLHLKMEEVVAQSTKNFETYARQAMSEIERLSTEAIEKLRQHAAAVASEKTWGVVMNVAQYLLSGTSIVVGAVVCAGSPVAGGMLIASGVLGLTNKVLYDTGAYEKIAACFTQSLELQRTYAARIQIGMFFLTLGLGLAGGVMGHRLGLLSAAGQGATALQNIASGVALGATLGREGARLQMAFAKKKSDLLAADMQDIETEKNGLNSRLIDQTKRIETEAELLGDVADDLKRAVATNRANLD